MRTITTAVFFIAASAASSSAQVSGTVRLVSIGSAGEQGDHASQYGSISDDGRFAVFQSNATTLVPGDTNGKFDVFLHDLQTGQTTRVSVSSAGVQSNGDSAWASIDVGGHFVVYQSVATNLVPSDSNNADDIFMYDIATAQTSRVSVTSSGGQGIGASAMWPGRAISANGQYILFRSFAGLVTGDANGYSDAYVHDLQNGATERVSTNSSGAQLNANSGADAISGDGNLVLFWSDATNVVPGDTNNLTDYFVKNRATGAVIRVNVAANGVQDNATGLWSQEADMSDDGRYVAFHSAGTNLVPGDTNSRPDLFVKDTLTAAIWRADVGSTGQQSLGSNFAEGAFLSADGRFAVFSSGDSSLTPGFGIGSDADVHDHLTGSTLCFTHAQPPVTSGGWSDGISANGRYLMMTVDAQLVPEDTNGSWDAYVVDRGALSPMTYCTAGTTTNGCTPAMSATADPSATFANACSLNVIGVEGQRSGLLFYGVDNSNYFPLPWSGGTSLRCVQPPVQRTSVQNSGGTADSCDGAFSLDWNAYQQAHPSALGAPWNVGAHVFVQAWFRDPPAASATNLSNAVVLTYGP